MEKEGKIEEEEDGREKCRQPAGVMMVSLKDFI